MGPKYRPVYEENKMKTIRLLYPDYISGGLDNYYFGAKLFQHILPQNENRPLIEDVGIYTKTLLKQHTLDCFPFMIKKKRNERSYGHDKET